MKSRLLSLLAVLLLTGSLAAQERTWTDDTGKFNALAELIKVEGDSVILRDSDGREVKVPINRLSEKDQEFVEQWKAKNKNPEETAGTADADWTADIKTKATAKREPGFDYDFNSNDPMPEVAINVEISGKAAAQALSFGKLNIESFKDGKGNDLTIAEEKFGTDITKEMDKIDKRGDGFFGHPRNGIRLKIKSIDKSGNVKKVSEIKGKVDVITGGTAKTATIKDVASHQTGDVESSVLDELGIKCDFQRQENSVQLNFEGDLKNLAGVKFVSKSGKEVEPNGWSAGGGGGTWQNSYDFEKIPSADLVMEFRIDPVTVTLPFEVKNVTVKSN